MTPTHSILRPRVLALLATGLLAACSEPADPPRPPPRHSLLLVTIDTTRADRIGCYGLGEAAGTATLDALAREGVVFLDARTAAPITLPAHATILTGLYPPSHGIRDNGLAALAPEATTLADVFRSHGARTAAFVSAFVLSARFGLDQGFDVYDEVQDIRLLNGGLMQERPANETVDRALEWLRGVEGPFFLWVHLFDPHSGYLPPEPFASRFAEDPYQGEIAFADREIGRLVAAARTAGDPLVVVTADHGEGLSEHGERTHGSFVYDSTLRVPLIVSGPGTLAGHRVEDAVSLVDLMPTIVDLCGLHAVETDGVSLARSITHGDPAPARDPIYFETYWGFLNQGWSPLIGVTDGRDKLIDAPRRERYDLSRDPLEARNLYADDDPRCQAMLGAARRMASRTSALARMREVSEEERRTLAEMGYVSGGDGGTGSPLPSADLPDPKDWIHLQDARDRALELLSLHDRTGDPRLLDECVTLVRSALEDHPHGAILNEFAGLALARQGRYLEAIPHFEACLSRRPDNLDARYALAFARFRSGTPAAAIRELERCLEQEPLFVKAARLLAEIHENLGRTGEAMRYLEYFLDRWPYDDEQAAEVGRALLRLREESRGG